MAGFCIEVLDRFSGRNRAPLSLVSLGCGEERHSYSSGPIRAVWSRWPESRHQFVRREPEGLLWIEGQPDRWPTEGESLDKWIPGRWGSFRGFSIDGRAQTLTLFGDPLGTRPVFYLRIEEAIYASDKLSTLAAQAGGKAQVNWGALLEALAMAALYSEDTTLAGAAELPPGAVLQIQDGEVSTVRRCPIPEHPAVDPGAVNEDPSGTLYASLRCAVEEVWVDLDAPLLLSGGLDSRMALRLAGPGRKAITITSRQNRESRIASRVARLCGAEWRHFTRPVEQYHRVVRDADLIGAGMYLPTHAHHLYMTSVWRREHGIPGLAHACLFGTILKSRRFIYPLAQGRASPTGWDGMEADVLQHIGQMARSADGRLVGQMVGLLSEDGRDLLRYRLQALAEGLPTLPVDGFETALERRIMSHISRHSYYPNLLSWMEESDVSSPIFHPAIWGWFSACRPRNRYQFKAYNGALQMAGADLWKIPDSNTGRPLFEQTPIRDLWDRHIWSQQSFVRARRAIKTLAGIGPRDVSSWPPYAPIFRLPAGRALLEEGLAELERSPLFDHGALRTVFEEYSAGGDHLVVPVLAIVGAARWSGRVRDCQRDG